MTNLFFARLRGRSVVSVVSVVLAGTALLSACASGPRPPDWQMEAKDAMERSVTAYLEGNDRIEEAELARARRQLSRTGRADWLASAELLHCASRLASLVFEPCAGFAPLRPDALEAQRAYADYLSGQVSLSQAQIALLPEAQRTAAAAAIGDSNALVALVDPLAQLVAAGALLQSGKASSATVMQAVDTASAQGWHRPLLAWLGAQLERAEQAGDAPQAARLHRRIHIVQSKGVLVKPAP